MSIYLLLYIIIPFLMLFTWYKWLSQYQKYSHQKYFFISILLYSIWLIFYLLSFTITYDKNIVLIFSKLLYWISLIAWYSMLFFIIFFNIKKISIKYHILIWIIFISFLLLTANTPFIINDMIYSENIKLYHEDFWKLYPLYTALYLIYPFLLVLFSYLKIKKLNTINKARLKYILLWFSFYIINAIIFLSILPLFDIWIFQKEQILFFIPFIIGTWYSINKYHYMNIKIWLLKIISYILSIWLSIITTYLIKIILYNYYTWYSWKLNLLFWKQSKLLSEYDLFLYISISLILFIVFHKIINNILKYDSENIRYSKKINRLKKEIPFITNLNDLNNFLKIKFKKLFNIKYVEIKLNNRINETSIFFSSNKNNKLFINNIVFIEENKNKFNYSKLKNEIDSNSYLIFPIKNNNTFIWIFQIGTKQFWDDYYTEEINILHDFVQFLEWHMKYISIYKRINELNLNLDKLVDEKTIEYNTLINKQKEFISYISHEIKMPITNSIFQTDCIINNINEWNYTKTSLIKSLNVLNSQLLKSWDLSNRLFSIEKYDINKCKLFKKEINLNTFLVNEIKIFEKIENNIFFDINIESKPRYIDIDIIQFTQVIDNLITNSIKFCSLKKKIIKFSTYTKWNYIYIVIEDSWIWFKNIDIKCIFDKYSTWNSSSAGLWMWLYLCKKITELHNWDITASKSEKLWWAKFTIKLPK